MLINTDKVRLLAAQQGITLGGLADRAGISRPTLSAALTRGSCRADTVVKIANALGIVPNDIIRPMNNEMTDRLGAR